MDLLLRVAIMMGLSLVLVAVGCGRNDTTQPLGAYLAVLDVAEDESKAALDEAFAEYNASVTQAQTDDEVVAALRLVLRDIGSITEQYYSQIRAAVPPPGVRSLHDDAVRSQADIILLLLDLRDRAAFAELSSDVEALLLELESGQEFTVARDRLEEAFCAIQEIGTAEGIDADDIGCDR